jgi:hypothetical protein
VALAAHTPTTWDTILSTTMHNYRKSLTDNIFGSRPLLEYLMSKGRVRTIDGGISIVEPLLLGPGEANSYGPWQQLAVNAVAGISAAQYAWRQLYATIIISGLEEAQNNGKEQAISLVEAKVMQAEETLKDLLSKMAYGTRGGAALPTDFTPLTTIIDATAAAGGITPAAAPAPENNWRSPTWDAATNTGVDAEGGAITMPGPALTSPYDGKELETALRHMFLLASDGGSDHVDAIFAGAGWYEAYEGSLTPQVRYTDTSKANLGFQNLLFKNVPLYWDPDAPSGTALGLNSKYVGLTIHSDRNFSQSPFTSNLSGSVSSNANANPGATAASPAAYAIDARVSFITTYGNFTTRQRRRNFKITGATFG